MTACSDAIPIVLGATPSPEMFKESLRSHPGRRESWTCDLGRPQWIHASTMSA